jgi:hypothetical protein
LQAKARTPFQLTEWKLTNNSKSRILHPT